MGADQKHVVQNVHAPLVSRSQTFYRLWTVNTEAVGAVMPNSKEMPTLLFSEKLKERKREKIYLISIVKKIRGAVEESIFPPL